MSVPQGVSAPRWAPEVVEVIGRFAAASNATLLATTADGERVIYKPVAGEAPLWDFPPDSLAVREVLTYEASRALGFDVVPETVWGSGPFGPGAVQRFVDEAPDFDAFALVRSCDPVLWPVAVLDVVCNNADRKLGHLVGTGHRLWAIDHGLTFHPEDKLRTVLWGFAGRPLPEAMHGALDRFVAAVDGDLGNRLVSGLGAAERSAARHRAAALRRAGHHPHPPDDRPAVPWPPY